MIRANLHRQIISHLLAVAVGGVLTLAVFAGGGLPGLRAPNAAAARGPASYLPSNPNIRSSSVRYLEQYFLHDHLAATIQMRQQAPKSGPHTFAPRSLFTAPGGALSFNSDSSAFPQKTESYAVDPTTTSSQIGMIGVGGFTDLRGFYLPSNTGAGYAVSINQSCTAGTCAHLMKDGWIPGVTDPACTDGSVLLPTGEPSVAASASGVFYYASMAAPAPTSTCANMNGDQGLIIATSTASLKNPAASCNDALTTNSCWTSTFVENSDTGCATSVEPCGSDDAEVITVDPVSGTLTMAWDYFDSLLGGQYIQATTCTAVLSCSAPVTVSTPESGCPGNPAGASPKAGTGGFSGCETFSPDLAIWHNPTSNANNVILTYETIGNTSPYNTDLHLADLTTLTDQIVLSLAPYQAASSLSADQLAVDPHLRVAADFRSVTTPHIYVTWEQCKSLGADYYSGFGFGGPDGACAQSVVHVQDFTSPTGTGTGISVLGGFNQFFPSLAVDEVGASAGQVVLAYYSTQGDTASALIRPYAATSSGGASPTAFSANTYQGVLTGNFRYTADPFLSSLGFVGPGPGGGVFGVGDYIQVAAANGAILLHFNATFEQKSGPSLIGTALVNQSDNYLCYIQPGTAISVLGACSSV